MNNSNNNNNSHNFAKSLWARRCQVTALLSAPTLKRNRRRSADTEGCGSQLHCRQSSSAKGYGGPNCTINQAPWGGAVLVLASPQLGWGSAGLSFTTDQAPQHGEVLILAPPQTKLFIVGSAGLSFTAVQDAHHSQCSAVFDTIKDKTPWQRAILVLPSLQTKLIGTRQCWPYLKQTELPNTRHCCY